MIGDHQRDVPLGLAPPDPVAVFLEQRRVRLVPLRTLPARRLEEDGAELLLARVVRRQPNVAVRRPLLERVDDPVRLVEPLAGARLYVRRGLLMLPEARRIGGVQVDVRLAVDHPLGQRLSDPGPSLIQTAAADQSPFTSGGSPRIGMPSGVSERIPLIACLMPTDSSPTIDGISSSACSICSVEVVLRERELGRRKRRLLDRRQILRVVEDRAVRVRPDLEPGAVLALVHVRVHVADDRELDVALRVGEPVRRADVDHLVHCRRERDAGAGHARRASDSTHRRR